MATKIGLTFSHTVCVCVGVYVFVRLKYMCTYYRAPKAREQRSSDCMWHSKTHVSAVSIAEGARAAVVGPICLGLHAASGEAASISISSQSNSLKFHIKVRNNYLYTFGKFQINRIDRTQTLPKRVVKIDIKATYL